MEVTTEITVQTRTIEQKGITLPWERWTRGPVYKDGVNLTPDRPETPQLMESGEVFIPMDTIYELAEQDRWDSQFSGSAFLLGPHEGLALVAAGLAEEETKGGYHRTDKLLAWLDEEGLR